MFFEVLKFGFFEPHALNLYYVLKCGPGAICIVISCHRKMVADERAESPT